MLLGRLHRWLQSHWTVRIYFAVTLLIGLWVAQDYGISWDEKAMVVLGEEAFEYVFHGHPYPAHVGIRFHGAFLEIVLHGLQELFHITYARHLFMFRHAAGFVVFWIGMIALYAIALRHFRSRSWALLAALIYFVSPRQFGHAFINTRDIPAMVFFTIKMFTLMIFLDRKTTRSAVLHGLASGMVLALRVGGLFVPIYTAIFMALEILRGYIDDGRVAWKRYVHLMIVYTACFAASTIALWPLLWEKPLYNFLIAMDNMMSKQQAPGGFYFGQQITGVPWHWVPVHFVTKTPLLYVILFLVGAAVLLRAVFREPKSVLRYQRNVLLFLTWFVIPIAIVVIMNATLFDEWRHLYFIYPATILLAVHGLRSLWMRCGRIIRSNLRMLSQGLTIIIPAIWMSGTALWMVQNHPLQYVYYSIPSRYVEYNFELDYWGLSYRQGFEWILENETDPIIPVFVTSSPGWENPNILTSEQRRRLTMWKKYTPKYVMDNFDWMEYKHVLPDSEKVHSIKVSGMEVLNIYRDPNWTPDQVIDPKDAMEDHDVQMWFNPESTP
jgi:hypothetical protein